MRHARPELHLSDQQAPGCNQLCTGCTWHVGWNAGVAAVIHFASQGQSSLLNAAAAAAVARCSKTCAWSYRGACVWQSRFGQLGPLCRAHSTGVQELLENSGGLQSSAALMCLAGIGHAVNCNQQLKFICVAMVQAALLIISSTCLWPAVRQELPFGVAQKLLYTTKLLFCGT